MFWVCCCLTNLRRVDMIWTALTVQIPNNNNTFIHSFPSLFGVASFPFFCFPPFHANREKPTVFLGGQVWKQAAQNTHTHTDGMHPRLLVLHIRSLLYLHSLALCLVTSSSPSSISVFRTDEEEEEGRKRERKALCTVLSSSFPFPLHACTHIP